MTSTLDSRSRWRRVIWSCAADRGLLLTRYYVIDRPSFGIYLHHLQTSDEDRALHDHPWTFITFLIGGGYYEWVETTAGLREYWRPRFSVLYRPAEWRHRLSLVRPTWTLVIRFKARRLWGFWTPSGFMDHKAYGREFCD